MGQSWQPALFYSCKEVTHENPPALVLCFRKHAVNVQLNKPSVAPMGREVKVMGHVISYTPASLGFETL
ncbi:MAG: hypothetical protein A3A77_02930 [Candidatus Blackburnbacteria bacterium RIFCSPLOWO2_01_FULL_40_20]|uniref:Uncharacterized protein n=1 Tax=Candidatus Blackburnbacteria bacterium RIFCSPLOWO2_01_FULL_40_20 TaxID=1797519 RepID=A0A1G1VBS5_9BACT|nr:MAG: hypothetical protein A3A77_02930 [Candidatus Blackburnbacteria bacterium RIFCSPLOWO2_01_FULL_40_20]